MLVTAQEYILPGCPIKLSTFKDSNSRKSPPDLNQNGNNIRQEFKE
jgi:hypothetical protein